MSPEGVETVPDPADHLGVNYRWLGQRPRTPDGCKCRADNVERQADAPGRAEMASSGKVGDLITWPPKAPQGHRRTSQRGCSPPDSGKAIIFRAKTKFFGHKPAAKNNFKNVCLWNEIKWNTIPSSEISAQNPGFLVIIIGLGESGKVILQFFGRCRKTFRAKFSALLHHLEKIGPMHKADDAANWWCQH